MPAAPPKLPPIVKGVRDEFSGARDILRAMGLKPAHDHFLAAGRPPAALNCDTELRQGQAMELAPLLEAPPPAAAKALEVLDRDRARAAFSFKPTPFSLREEDLGTVPAVIRRAKSEEAAAAAAAGNAAKSTGEGGAPEADASARGEKRKRDKKEKKEKKEKKRRRGDPSEPSVSALTGGDSGVTSG
jgi:hypothetical protein